MAVTTNRDQSPKIEDHVFGSESDADDIGLLVTHNKSLLTSRLESLPETSPEPDRALRCEIESAFSLYPAMLRPSRMTCKRVRFSSSTNRTYAAVRVDIPYEGNGNALRWQVPPDMLYASQIYWDKDGRAGRMPQHWCLSEEDSTVSFYVILPPSGSESAAEAEQAAAGLAPRIRHIIDVLASMRRISDEWNGTIPSLIDKIVSSRKEASARREVFLKTFRDKVSNLLLSSKQ